MLALALVEAINQRMCMSRAGKKVIQQVDNMITSASMHSSNLDEHVYV
jgi:hypothetical protein